MFFFEKKNQKAFLIAFIDFKSRKLCCFATRNDFLTRSKIYNLLPKFVATLFAPILSCVTKRVNFRKAIQRIGFRSFESSMPSVILVCKDGIEISKPIIHF